MYIDINCSTCPGLGFVVLESMSKCEKITVEQIDRESRQTDRQGGRETD